VLQRDPVAVRCGHPGRLMVQARARHGPPHVKRAREDPAAGRLEVRDPPRRCWTGRCATTPRPAGRLAVVPASPWGRRRTWPWPRPGWRSLSESRGMDRAYGYDAGTPGGVITNGAAVLGLQQRPASQVMGGRCPLQALRRLDAFDVGVDETDPDRFVDTVCALAPTFGGSASRTSGPECFAIETECQRRVDAPRRPARRGHRGGRGPPQPRGTVAALEDAGRVLGRVAPGDACGTSCPSASAGRT
jgi:hypothetical protein